MITKKIFDNYFFLFSYSILLLILFYISNYLFLSELIDPKFKIISWNLDQYLLNYNIFGFVKRGLLGTIFNINEFNLQIVPKVLSLINLIFISITTILIFRKISEVKLKKYFIILTISPFFFYQLGFDFGRFDQFGVSFFLITLALICYGKSIKILEIFAPFLILIHEIHFFSVIIFFIYIQFLLKRNFLNIIYVVLMSILILLLLFYYGGIENNIYNLYKDKYWFVETYFSKSHLVSSMAYWPHVFSFNTTIFYRHLISIIIFFLIFLFFKKKKTSKKFLLLFFSFSPCFIIGIDHARFLSLFILNISLIILTLKKFDYSLNVLPQFKNYLFFIIFIGPWGVNICLPILTIIKKIVLYGKLTF